MAFVTSVMEHGWNEKYLNGSTMKDRSKDSLHHEQTIHHVAPSVTVLTYLCETLVVLRDSYVDPLMGSIITEIKHNTTGLHL